MSLNVFADLATSGVQIVAANILAFDSSGSLYISSESTNNIYRVNSLGASGEIFASSDSISDISLNFPLGIAFDASGYLYVSNSTDTGPNANSILKISPDGQSGSVFASNATLGADFNIPQGLAFDTLGNLYVANANAGTVLRITPNGNLVETFASTGISGVTIRSPVDLAFDTSGNLYIVNTTNNNIIRVNSQGVSGEIFASTSKSNVTFNSPTTLAFDNSGYLYITNNGNDNILRVNSQGLSGEIFTSTIIGGVPITNPYGIAFDTSDYLYIAISTANSIIYKTAAPVCFNHDTKILCLNHLLQEEYIPIQDLKKGDFVKTYLHGFRKIDYIYKSLMINNPNQWKRCMYKMKKTEENGLLEDLIVTGRHSIMVDSISEVEQERYNKRGLNNYAVENKIDEKYLLLSSISEQFIPLTDNETYTIYHFSVENDGNDSTRYGVWANGILSETASKRYLVEQR